MSTIGGIMNQMVENPKLSYELWENEGKCPHCGSPDLEYTYGEWSEYIECPECGNESAELLLTPEEYRILEIAERDLYNAFIEEQKLHGNKDDDPFKPPQQSVLVECWHCSGQYQSSDMVYEQRPEISELKFWYCKNKDCNGAGYGFDIIPVRSKL